MQHVVGITHMRYVMGNPSLAQHPVSVCAGHQECLPSRAIPPDPGSPFKLDSGGGLP
jgi:hypothetical protein